MKLYARMIPIGLLLGFIPLLPMTILFHSVMLKKDKKNNYKTTVPHIVASYMFCIALLSILSAIGIPMIHTIKFNPNLNFVPFTNIFTNHAQYINNILLFIPFGFLLPMSWTKFDKKYITFMYGALFSLSIEVLQMFCLRATDINDLLMNTAGTIAGYYLFILIKRFFPKISVFSIGDSNHWKWEPYLCFVSAWLSMLIIEPFVLNWLVGPRAFAPDRERGMPIITVIQLFQFRA